MDTDRRISWIVWAPLRAPSLRIALRLIVMLWLCAAPSVHAQDARPPGFGLSDLDGRWTQRDVNFDAEARRAAIDTAIQRLSWVVRKMAGGVLHSTTTPDPTVHFVWDGKQLHQRLNGKRGVTTRIVEPGAPAATGLDARGEPFEGQWIWTAEGLQFAWRQHQAHGANLYRVDPARRELTIDHSIHVTALDDVEPILFRSRFVQADLPAVSAAGTPASR